MSGGRHHAAGRLAERADVLAYLARRRANAALVAERSPEFSEWASELRRQLDVMIQEIGHELHLGAADVAADLGVAP